LEKAALVPLGVPEIGQTAAWRYDPSLSVIAIESSRSGLSIGKFMAYVRSVCDCRGYGALHVITDANVEAIKNARIREVSIQLATPKNLHTVAAYQQTMSSGLGALMSENLGTMLEVRYSLRVGEPDIQPGKVERLVRWLRGEHTEHRGDITKVQTRIIDDEGRSDELDMLDVHLQDQRELALPDDDPDRSYEIRKRFLSAAFTKHEATLLAQFGP
jgi:hypothetical protein